MKQTYTNNYFLLLGLILLRSGQMTSAQTLSFDKTEYDSGEAIVATFAGGPNNRKDWIGIYLSNQAPGSVASRAYLYVNGNCRGDKAYRSGSVTFNSASSCVTWPLPPGPYSAYFLENDKYTILDGPVKFTIAGSSRGDGTLTLDKSSYYEGETITATFTGAPGNALDWMGIWETPNGGAPSACIAVKSARSRNYTDGHVDGTVTIHTPFDFGGTHVAQLLMKNGYCDIADPVTFTVLTGPTSRLSGPGGGKKVLFMMMDGVRPDALARANTPNIDSLILNGAYDGNASTNSATFSGPGWSDLLTGVTTAKHNVTSNSYTHDINLKDWPSWLDILETEDASINTASVSSWDLVNAAVSHHIDHRVMHDGYALGWDTADLKCKNDVKTLLADTDVDALFLPFAYTDELGHAHGTLARETIEYIEVVDGYIGELVSTIEGRSTFSSEDWLILMGTDHGRTTAGGHGGTTSDEKWVYFLASGRGSAQGTSVSNASNVDFATTAIAHMLGSVPARWNLDGTARGLRVSGASGSGSTATDLRGDHIAAGSQNAGGQKPGTTTVTNCND
ncbi:MAG: alkaline phosphatase family protein [Planctomycetes bacterium]|nr:alkaline phosphatase family protein [Planctomycetota bacterium]